MQKNPQIVELNFVQNFKRIIIKDKQKTEEVSKILKCMEMLKTEGLLYDEEKEEDI